MKSIINDASNQHVMSQLCYLVSCEAQIIIKLSSTRTTCPPFPLYQNNYSTEGIMITSFIILEIKLMPRVVCSFTNKVSLSFAARLLTGIA